MAGDVRKVKTQVVFEGEEEYKKACKEINQNLGVLASELKVVSAEYDKNDKSVEALKARQEVLSKVYEEQKRKVEENEKALSALKEQYPENTDAIARMEKALNNSKAAMLNTEKELKQIDADLETAGNGFEEMGEQAEEAVSSLGGEMAQVVEVVAKVAKVVGQAALTIGKELLNGCKAAVEFADEAKSAMNSFEAATGIANAGAEGFEQTMLNIYNGNYGESFEDIAESMATVAQSSKEVDPSSIEELTTGALALRDTFGYDIQEQMRAVNMLMDQFGISGEEAFNLIAQGAQNGLDKNGDLLDSINEYSVHFKQLGLDADQMFNALANGANRAPLAWTNWATP